MQNQVACPFLLPCQLPQQGAESACLAQVAEVWFGPFPLSTACCQALGWRGGGGGGGQQHVFMAKQLTEGMTDQSWTGVGVLLDMLAVPVRDKEKRSWFRSHTHSFHPSVTNIWTKSTPNGWHGRGTHWHGKGAVPSL